MNKALLLAIKIYRKLISPYFISTCRFYPSCSRYAEQALCKKGLLKGAGLAAWRILRCNPFSSGGHDPVE